VEAQCQNTKQASSDIPGRIKREGRAAMAIFNS
jgi:hypothetical protein